MQQILIVEDEADISELMSLHLKREGYGVTVVADGEKGIQLMDQSTFDLAVLDWMLPGVTGLELCKKFKGKLPILLVTAKADTADIVQGLEAGADDYITKPFDLPVFLARVKSVLRRGSDFAKKTEEVFQLQNLKLDWNQKKAWIGTEELKLTFSELKTLYALFKERGRVLTREELIKLVQGDGVIVSTRTIDNHILGLRKKLGASAESLIETIRGVGYRLL